ncbi:MAG: hypothetical protein ACR2PS_19440, partial [Pseudomonadales bacterium]
LITTDVYRISAYEQLLTIGKILDVEVEVVDAQQQGLQAALDKFANKSLVLVDTGGLRRNDRDLAAQLAEIRRQGERLNPLLVLPANIQYSAMQAAYESYQVKDYAGLIISKLDESSSLGAAVSLAVSSAIPLAYITSGHTIPDDICRLNGARAIEQLLNLACREQDLPMEQTADFKSVMELAQQRQLEMDLQFNLS